MVLLTREEAAERLRIGVRTLDRRLATGELKCYRLGDGPRAPVRISDDQIREYLDAATRIVSEQDRSAARAILQRNAAGAA